MRSEVIIIPAAGSSSRLGRPKQLVELKGETLVRRAARIALGVCENVIVVTGYERGSVEEDLRELAVETRHNQVWETGLGSSIAVGVLFAVKAFDPERVLVHLCDQPTIDSNHLDRLFSESHNSELVMTKYDDSEGVPAVFGRPYFERLLSLSGDAGAKSFLSDEEVENARFIHFEGDYVDVDTQDDIERLGIR